MLWGYVIPRLQAVVGISMGIYLIEINENGKHITVKVNVR